MPFSRTFLLPFFLFTLVTVPCFAATSAQSALAPSPASVSTLASQALSVRVVAYQIDARFDAVKNTLDATEVLTYRNLTGQPQDTFPFHLYLNAFQPTSTYMKEQRRASSTFEWEDKYRASAEVRSLEVVGMGDLTSQIRFIAPDDGNLEDRTVFQVKLPRPVAPNESVQFKIAFHDQFGEVFSRTGYKRDSILGGQWFPKIGMWWQGAWNCHQFHASTEFFANFGTFDVKLTVPRNEVVGASGVQLAEVNNRDGTKTLTFRGEDIHDFAWTAQPDYRVVEHSFTGSMGNVKIRLLMQPGHVSQAARHMRIMKETMKRFEEWYGPYPYKQITVVDPAYGGGQRAGGMEYPMLITGNATWWMPEGVRLLEQTLEHEFGHQYWYGMVATNEFEDPWLDEGLNSYTECKILDDIFGKEKSLMDLWGITESDAAEQRNSYRAAADLDPISRFAYQYINGVSYYDIVYGKTTTVLFTLEKVIGEETLKRAIRTYFMRYRFKHPTKEDFLKTVEEVSGQNLRWYFDQAVYGTQVLDYEILRASSDRTDWYVKDPPNGKQGETMYRTMVLVHRKGDFIFPVDVAVKFDNGETVTEHWDGRDRWVSLAYDKKAKLVSAQIDPENAVLLDKNYFNNSYTKESDTRAARKLLYYWTWITQIVAQWLAWLV